MENKESKFIALARSRFKFGFFMLTKLPAAYFSGLRIERISTHEAAVSLRYKWLTQNPFRSIYFASLAMAAELSTGLLAMHAIWGQKPTVSMLVFSMRASFTKKAVGKIVFTCANGDTIWAAVQQAIATQQGQTVEALSVGHDEQGDEVARFTFTWTFKQKNRAD